MRPLQLTILTGFIAILSLCRSAPLLHGADRCCPPITLAAANDLPTQQQVDARRLRALFERRGELTPETPYTLPEDTTPAGELNALRLELQTLRSQLTRAGLPVPTPVQTAVPAIEDPETLSLLQRIAGRLEAPTQKVAPPLITAATGIPIAITTLIVAILFAVLKRDTNSLKKMDIKAAVVAAVEATPTKLDDRLLALLENLSPRAPPATPTPSK